MSYRTFIFGRQNIYSKYHAHIFIPYLIFVILKLISTIPYRWVLIKTSRITHLLALSFGALILFILQASVKKFFCDLSIINFVYMFIFQYQTVLSITFSFEAKIPATALFKQRVFIMSISLFILLLSSFVTIFLVNKQWIMMTINAVYIGATIIYVAIKYNPKSK